MYLLHIVLYALFVFNYILDVLYGMYRIALKVTSMYAGLEMPVYRLLTTPTYTILGYADIC